MKKLKVKIISTFVLLIILVSNFLPISFATYQNLSVNETSNTTNIDIESNTIIDENITNLQENNNTIMTEINNEAEEENVTDNQVLLETEEENNFKQDEYINVKEINDFDVMLAGILSDDNTNFTYSDVNTIISNGIELNEHGVWASEKDREFILNFINTISNNIYSFNEKGFLVKESEKTGNEIRESYSYYTDKIDELISSEKTIILSIENGYKSLNEYDNTILDMFIEKEDFSMLFTNKSNEFQEIALLNIEKYNNTNEFDSLATLMNHFLELFYFEDEEFIEYIQDKINYAQAYSFNILEMKDGNNTEKQYKVALAGIINDSIKNISEIDNILNRNNNRNGLWISERSREYLINFINSLSQIQYGVDNDGYLQINSLNGIEEKNYNYTERSLNEIINGDKFIAIDINNYYMEQLDNSNEIEKFNIDSAEYKKVFTTSESKLLILNSELFSISNEEDDNEILMSYILEEFLFQHEVQIENDEYGIEPMYSGDYTGNMNSAQNVYAGPSNDGYAKVGSVSSGEEVHVLEGEFGWYQIRYETASGKKVGFVPKSSVPNVNISDTSVPYDGGGLAFSHSGNVDIYYGYPTTDYVKVGQIYQGEGVTFLQRIGQYAYVEYSSSAGTKRGLVEYSKIFVVNRSSVARVKRTSSAYAGPDTDFVKLGGAYYNEYVTILEKVEDWVYVEYNTNKGRKCGYMSASNLEIFKSMNFYDFSTYNGLKKATQQLTVYGGPNSNYANLGLVYNQEIVSYLRNIERVGKQWAYIEYTTKNGAKRGYVEADKLIDTQNPSIPNIPLQSNFYSSTYYPHKTACGNDLKYYSIGHGDNTVFMVYGQHGWEDAWAADSVELVNIANNVMSNLASFYNERPDVFDYWKIYIIPTANPDGITHGYSNNGPGRCTVEAIRRIDMNRSWPANFSPYYTSRNYTGPNPLGKKDEEDYGAGEIRGLKDFIDSNKGNNNIILDVHGWLNQTYGDVGIGRYFSNHFGFKNNGTYGTGYLIRYGQSIGAKSCLVELPMPSNAAEIISNNFSGKLASSMRDLLVGEMGQTLGGEDVNETCKIVTTGTVNVRQQPNTSSTIVTSLTNGTIVTRIKKGVTNSNGYTWDKIRLSDGREGYIATNFLQITANNDIIFKLDDSDSSIQALKAYLRYNNINNYNDTPTPILDEDTVPTIKVFQSSKGLPQTGNFDRYTIEAMGFSITSSNKIEENSYYKQYLEYAQNYINYGNATQVTYVEIPVYMDDLGKYNRFVYGKTSTTISPFTQNNIDSMQSKFNQMPQEEKDQRSKELSDIENHFNSLANNLIGKIAMSNASASLSRYMDGTGSFLLHTDLPEKVEKNTAHYNLYKTYVRRAADAAEKFAPEGNKEFSFALEYEASAQFGDSSKNLWASIGKYRIEMVCNVKKVNTTYTMDVTYTIKDYYDWVEGSEEVFDFVVTQVVENDGFLLHYSGRARAFHQAGSPLTGTYTWEKGNSQSAV